MAKKYKNTVHKNPFREDRPKKPFPWLTVVIAVLAIAVIVLSSVLLYERFGAKIRNFTSDMPGESVYDPRSGINYTYNAMNSYQASRLVEGPYATCGEYNFYEIEGIDPEIMLFASLKEVDMEIPYGLFSVADYKYPKPEELKISSGSVHQTEYNSVSLANMTKEVASSVMEIFLNRESSSYPVGIDGDSVLEVYFYSENYSYISYVIKFFRTDDGDRYLSDSVSGRHIKLEEGEFLDYFPTAE